MNKLPRDIILIISKMHPLLIPPFTNDTLRRAVEDYVAGGARKEDIKKKYGEINNWDVSNVTDMTQMFYNAESFNQPLNKWNVSKVTNMSYMFGGATSFNQPLDNWNVSNVTNMGGMFYNAESFNQPLNKWNLSKVKNMSHMFCSARSFNQPLNKWNVSKVTEENPGVVDKFVRVCKQEIHVFGGVYYLFYLRLNIAYIKGVPTTITSKHRSFVWNTERSP